MLDIHGSPAPGWFTVDEVAAAADIATDEVWRVIALGQAVVHRQGMFVSTEDAVHLVRLLAGSAAPTPKRALFNHIPPPVRKTMRSLGMAGAVHAVGLLTLIGLPWLALVDKSASGELPKPETADAKLVYLMMPGPGGGVGGGGLNEPKPPPPAKKKAPVVIAMKHASRVPPTRPHAAPPPPRPVPPRHEARVIPAAIDMPVTPIPQAVQAPVKSIAADPLEVIGAPIEGPPAPPSRGPGTGGGTGGGPYQPGAGIDPPTLVREVRPSYTDAARRQAIEGDVVLEIVVRDD